MKSIVTGGAGFIGSHLVDRLVELGDDVLVIDDLSSGRQVNVNPAARLEELDIRAGRVVETIGGFAPDRVFHAAAQISVSLSAREPALDAEINILGALNVLDAVRKAHGEPARFVFFSTGGAMYGEPDELPAPESLPASPGSPYGASKHAVEVYLPVYARLFGIKHTTLRLANVFGPRQDPHGEAGVVAIFTRAMLANEPVTIFGDGNDERDYVYVDDVVRAMVMAADSGGSGPYNVGTGTGTNVNDLFIAMAELCGYERRPVYAPPRAGDIARISLDSRLIEQEMGWRPQTELVDGLARTVSWFKSGSAG